MGSDPTVRMVAYRAYFWSFFSHNDVTTVATLPYTVTITGEYKLVFYVIKKLSITLFKLGACHQCGLISVNLAKTAKR